MVAAEAFLCLPADRKTSGFSGERAPPRMPDRKKLNKKGEMA